MNEFFTYRFMVWYINKSAVVLPYFDIEGWPRTPCQVKEAEHMCMCVYINNLPFIFIL